MTGTSSARCGSSRLLAFHRVGLGSTTSGTKEKKGNGDGGK